MDELEEYDDFPVYLVDDFQEDDSDMDSVHTDVSELTEHTMSTLNSSGVTEYFQEINGRMFPADENLPQIFPTDSSEVRRLELQHNATKLLLKGNYFGPVKDVLADNPGMRRKHVLDLLTAEGNWVREMAAEFPHVDFTSVDTIPLVPHVRYANILGYEVYDLYNGIAEADDTFDLVHLRHATSKIRDIPALISEVHRVLRPGGLFLYGEYQINAFDASTEDHSAIHTAPCLIRALRITREAMVQQGAQPYAFRDVPPLLMPDCALWRMEELKGFTSIRMEAKMMSAGPWPHIARLREARVLTQQVWCDIWRGLPPILMKYGLSEEEAYRLMDGAIDELMHPGSRKIYDLYHVVYAFKPV